MTTKPKVRQGPRHSDPWRASSSVSNPEPITDPWAQTPEHMLEQLGLDPHVGLSSDQVARRQALYGPNSIEVQSGRSWLAILFAQFKGLLVVLLAAAAGMSAVFGQWPEAIAVLVVLLLNALIGFVTELRAVRSVEALRRLGASHANVRRDGAAQHVAAHDLVPGDVLILEAGDLVAADARVIKASQLEADESSLTGESVPVAKEPGTLPANTLLHGRTSILHKGTPVTRGSGEAVVVATGLSTELGRISQLVATADADESTPLEHRLAELARRLVWLTLIVAVLITLTGLGSGKSWLVLLQTAIALAVATVPEGLPIIATLTLARGVGRMAKRNALVNRLAAVETLGATSVILTDKTGTLTENRMRVSTLWLPGGAMELDALAAAKQQGKELSPELHHALTLAALCVTAELAPNGFVNGSSQLAPFNSQSSTNTTYAEHETNGVGDPLELALLTAARAAGIERPDLLKTMPEVAQVAFDSETRLMASAHRKGEGHLVVVKGAPGAVLDNSTMVGATDPVQLTEDAREEWLTRNRQLAGRGLRVLALAYKNGTSEGTLTNPYQQLTFVGLIGLADPPRQGVKAVLEQCGRAGIRVIMATGDQATTARAIAEQVGLPDADRVLDGAAVSTLLQANSVSQSELLSASVLARVAPEQKLDLVKLHQHAGNVVAMTGDGVNDAPALRRADIGVAMGQRGTEVAREAADMVLLDDSFSTIVAAVKEGRVIFDNIRAFVVYLLSCNLSEILVIGIAGVMGYPLPLLPLQILFLNLVTDVFPALALGTGRGDARILSRPPRPRTEPLLARRHWNGVVGYGALLTVTTLGAFVYSLGLYGTSGAVTVAFLSLALGQVWHVFNMRDPGSSLVNNQVTRNRWIWAATIFCTALLALAVVIPPVRQILSIELLDPTGWMIVVAAGLAPMLLGQVGKALGLGRVS